MTALQLVCPCCAATFPVEAGLTDLAARQALKAALDPWPAPLAPHLFAYLALFRPSKQGLRWPKLARVIDELATLVASGQVSRHHEARPAPVAAWGAGLAEVLRLHETGGLTLPLQGHGLLCEIVHRQAGQRQQQQDAASRPLHPSHRPATRPETPAVAHPSGPRAGDGAGGPGAAPRDPAARQAGLLQAGALAKALQGRAPRPPGSAAAIPPHDPPAAAAPADPDTPPSPTNPHET